MTPQSHITERKQFEDTLRESEEMQALKESLRQHRLLAETMLQGVVLHDAEGRIISVNPSAERILGRTRDEIMGSTWVEMEMEVITLGDDGKMVLGLEHPSMLALRTGQTVRDVQMGVFNPREMDYRWISVDAIPLFQPGARAPHQVYTVFTDISERKRFEMELQDQERLRIARDLHDQMGQLLAALKVEIKTLDNPLMKPADRDEALGRLRQIADSVGKELRHLVLELRPADLANQTLTDFLRNYVAEWSRRFQISADFLSQNLEAEQSPTALKNIVLRLVQEALTNIVKHAAARNISVILRQHRGQLQLIIEDDGVGFDPSRIAADGRAGQKLGLLGMQERVKFYGGMLEIEASPGQGASVFVSLPLSSFAPERRSNEQ